MWESGSLEVTLTADSQPSEPRPLQDLPASVSLNSAYIRLHPGDSFLQIPADKLQQDGGQEQHSRTEAFHRTRFPLYLTEGADLAVIPPPNTRIMDVGLPTGERLMLFDLPGTQQFITRIVQSQEKC
jgi:hypothetical protein